MIPKLGKTLKSKLYSDIASTESYLGRNTRSVNSSLNAIKTSHSLKNPPYDYIVSAYRYLAQQCGYNGNIDEAKRYLRQAEKIYGKHKKEIDKITRTKSGDNNRYEVSLLYSKIYILTKYYQSVADSFAVVKAKKN